MDDDQFEDQMLVAPDMDTRLVCAKTFSGSTLRLFELGGEELTVTLARGAGRSAMQGLLLVFTRWYGSCMRTGLRDGILFSGGTDEISGYHSV